MEKDYETIATKITERTKQLLMIAITKGQTAGSPEFGLREAILEAMKYAHTRGYTRAKENITTIIQEFDDAKDPTSI